MLVPSTRKTHRFLAIVLFLAAGNFHLIRSQIIQGRVIEPKYGLGIDSVKVTVKGTAAYAFTDSLGKFAFPVTELLGKQKIEYPVPYWDENATAIHWNRSAQSICISIKDMRGASLLTVRPDPYLGSYRLPIEQLQQGFQIIRVQADGHELNFGLFLWNGKIRKTFFIENIKRNPTGLLQKSAAVSYTLTLEKKGWITRDTVVNGTPLDFVLPLKREKIRVLIVDGFSNHNWKQTTIVSKAILNQTDFFQVDVTTSPAQPDTSSLYNAWNPNFKAYEIVLLNICNIFTPIRWPNRIKSAFVDFVSSGGGVYAFHASAANFSDWPEYLKIVGFTWESASYGPSNEIVNGLAKEISAGVGAGTGHGARSDALMQVNTSHPITNGMPKTWLTTDTEVYTYARTLPGVWANVTPMAWAEDKTNGTGKTWPIMILTQFGKGHGFTSLFGHMDNGDIYPARMADIGLHTTLIRSLEWMARKEIMFPIPKNFPTALKTSIDTTLHF